MNTRFTFQFLRIALGLVLLCSLALVDVSPASAAARRCYVRANAIGLNNGNSWANAYISLQSALGGSTCTEVWVAGGAYRPTGGIDRTKSFVLKNGVAIYGGFAGTETQLSQRDPVANPTILSGDIGDSGVATDNSYHVVVGTGTDSTAVLDGFAITAGRADGTGGSLNDIGAGMFTDPGSPSLENLTFIANFAAAGGGLFSGSGGSPSLVHVSFRGNRASNAGGGMYSGGGSPSFTNVIFSNNTASNFGGGLANYNNTTASLTNVTFSNNSGPGSGGGMYDWDSSPSLTNVTFSNNRAVGGNGSGGGMYGHNSHPSLINVTFSGNSANNGGGLMANGNAVLANVTFSANTATGAGGGLFNWGDGVFAPGLTNVTFSGNSAPSGGAMFNYDSNPTIKNSILFGDTGGEIANQPGSPSVTYSIVQGGYPGTGNLDANPLLGPLQNNGGFTRTMTLGAGSLAIDHGTNTGCPPADQRGVVRPQDGDWNATAICDMGATESRSFTLSFRSIAAQDGWVLESSETSGVGGVMDGSAATLAVGDTVADQQGRGILSFNTAALPDNAMITSVMLKIRKQGLVGTDPFTTHGNLLVDVRKGAFAANTALQLEDFQAPASKNAAITILNNPVGGWYGRAMGAANFKFINKLGITQFRLRFLLDDNDDLGADYLKFYTGDFLTVASRPKLIVRHYVP